MLYAAQRISLFAALFLAIGAPRLAGASWDEIVVPDSITDYDGNARYPSCSASPMAGVPEPVQTDSEFSFFVREGDPYKLAIFFDGGGACWDPNTCIGSAFLGEAIYQETVDENVADLETLPGLGDLAAPENPIADHTLVFIPYCTGDLHTGDADTTYSYSGPGGPFDWTIRHRGAANVAAVLTHLVDYYGTLGSIPDEVFLVGASAGGYGVLYHYPEIRGLLPWYTKVRVLVDAANGIINQDFYDRALAETGAWNAWENLADELNPAFTSGADDLFVETIKAVASIDRRARIGQYTTAFDAVQIGFYSIARNVDDPTQWFNPVQILFATLDWTTRARLNMISTALQAWNYRFYLASGADHTIVPSDKLYLEDSAGGIAFIDWLDDMINRRFLWGSDWRNLSCAPSCAD